MGTFWIKLGLTDNPIFWRVYFFFILNISSCKLFISDWLSWQLSLNPKWLYSVCQLSAMSVGYGPSYPWIVVATCATCGQISPYTILLGQLQCKICFSQSYFTERNLRNFGIRVDSGLSTIRWTNHVVFDTRWDSNLFRHWIQTANVKLHKEQGCLQLHIWHMVF